MEIYLKENNSIGFQLPVLPESIPILNTFNNTTVNIPTKGDINMIGTKGLREVTLTSFFPAQDYEFNQCERLEPEEYVTLIESWMGKVIRLIVTDVINMEVTIESFNKTYADNDIKYELSLKEYKRLEYQSTKSSKTINYTIKSNHTTLHGLKLIAKKYLGTSSKSSSIYKYNKSAIEAAAKANGRRSSSKGKYLYKGTKLVINDD